jgi:NADPH:quinone reductase-like Zn-dependent oxidoreductase
MRALVRDRYGPPDVLHVVEIDPPEPRDGEVLLRVHAASLNDWDWGLLHGPTLPFTFGAPRQRILGSDVAGRVVALGRGVQRARVGDDVYGDLSRFGAGGWGGFAEFVCARESSLVSKPAGMTFVQAAALPQAGQLAVQGLAAGGPLRPGMTVLINGGGGGVGTIGVQIAKTQGAAVTGVDRASKHDMMQRIGFDRVVDYEKEDFTQSGQRYDLILDTKTDRQPHRYARALNPGGTYATVGGPKLRDLFAVGVYGLVSKPLTGTTLRLVGLRANRDLPYLNERFEAGQLVPVIDGPYQLTEAREAFRHFGAGHHQGKVVIAMV